MECASASDSEADSVTISAGDPGGDMSDAEDAPAEEMPLWRAGVYTAEEAVLSALSALRALQAAYTSQAARLQHRLHGARAPYLRALKHERELYCESLHTYTCTYRICRPPTRARRRACSTSCTVRAHPICAP
ncbi:hypothetical protein O0L34_g13468 [Tuta absoluta]|nr:hypothetical protein O0L34_g13468 [Tuta absoluta]